jgi:hypothetical protein
MRMTTEATIQEIEESLTGNLSVNPNANYAVLYFDPHDNIYENVDWGKIAEHFKTEDIHSYTQGQKIVIDIDLQKFHIKRSKITSVSFNHPTAGPMTLYGNKFTKDN